MSDSDEDNLTPMTQAQIDALRGAQAILDEHFSSHILVLHVESEDGKRERAATTWSGGALMARALAYDGIDYISKSRSQPKED